MKISAILSAVETLAPRRLGESWDNNGLLVGRGDRETRSVLLGTDFTEALVEEAIALGAGCIVTHHPVMLKGVNRLTDRDPEQRAILRCVEAGIAHIAAHTNLDNATGGTNDTLADLLGLTNVRPIVPAAGEDKCKLVVFVPTNDVDTVSRALWDAGAGRIGRYTECSFRSPGTGTFRGDAGSNPTVGVAGRFEEAPEIRLETLVPAGKVDAAVAAMRRAHSYEEPAFDIHPLRSPGGAVGTGRLGEFAEPRSVDEILDVLKRAMAIPTIALVGPRNRRVTRAAICTGSCGKVLHNVAGAGAEFYLTGEMRHHDAATARDLGLTVAAVGHFASERIALFPLADRLRAMLAEVAFTVSAGERDPFEYV